MSQPSSQPSSQDCFTVDIELAKLQELVKGVSWRVLDIQKSAENILALLTTIMISIQTE